MTYIKKVETKVSLLLTVFVLLFCLKINSQNLSYATRQVIQLKEAQIIYNKIASHEWMYLSCDSCVSPGQTSDIILQLRQNLLLTNDLNTVNDSTGRYFDRELEKSLIQFQKRHGLIPDGILGPKTIDAFNVPISKRIGQIKNNIKRWNDLADTLSEPYLMVNIPDFSLHIIDSGKIKNKLAVVVGRPSQPTPVLISKIKSIVLNPDWKVPHSIATKEILPILKDDPHYLERNHMQTYTISHGKFSMTNPDSIDWKMISADNFNFQFVQMPGIWNALGNIKFIFENKYSVYLHDTPEKHIFSQIRRAYSHGCVRVEQPATLAAWLLNLSPSEIKKLLGNRNIPKTIFLSQPFQIVIEYYTCWVDENGLIQFREDIYNLDNN